MKKFRIELQNIKTLEFKTIFIEAKSLLEAIKEIDSNEWKYIQGFEVSRHS